MKNIFRFGIVLGLITIASGLGISGVYQLTRGRIAAKKEKAFADALLSVFPKADRFVCVDPTGARGDTPWKGKGVGIAKGAGDILGYLAVGHKQGYSSTIRVLVGCGSDFHIKAIRILSQAETPGLGERTKEVRTNRTLWQAIGEAVGLSKRENTPQDKNPWFQEQFSGKALGDLVVVKDSSEGIQAITGATISSKAVTEAVKSALETIESSIAPKASHDTAGTAEDSRAADAAAPLAQRGR